MKILVFNQDWFVPEFRAAGHEVITCGAEQHLEVKIASPLLHLDSIIKTLPGGFVPDCIVVHDNSAPIMIAGLEETDIPTVFYSVDTHHHYRLHSYLHGVFDHTFVAQKDFMQHFPQNEGALEWMPLYASVEITPEPQKKYGAVFIGTLNPALNPERVKFIGELEKKAPILCKTASFNQYFPVCEIALNQTVKSDLNFRVFEVMMCGAMLLTERSGNGLFELFQEGVHLATYEKNNVDEAADRIRYYLDHLDEARAIAQRGREEIFKKHLPIHRAQQMLAVLTKLKRRHSPRRYMGAVYNYVTAGLSLERLDTGIAARSYISALKAMHTAIEKGEQLTPDLAVPAALACLRYDQLIKTGGGQAMLDELCERFPAVALLHLVRVRCLLNSGRRDEAETIAQTRFSETPAELFAKSEEVVAALLSSVSTGP